MKRVAEGCRIDIKGDIGKERMEVAWNSQRCYIFFQFLLLHPIGGAMTGPSVFSNFLIMTSLSVHHFRYNGMRSLTLMQFSLQWGGPSQDRDNRFPPAPPLRGAI